MFKDLAKLFDSPSRIKVLKFFILQPEARVAVGVVSSTVGVPKASVERELRALVRLGMLSYRKQKNVTIFMLDESHTLVAPLRTFFETTAVPPDAALSDVFRKIRGLTLLVATGVLVRESRSSVDLLVVTKLPHDPRIAQAVKQLEAAVALPLRYAVLESSDYAGRMESYDRLLRDVFEFEHRVIIGRK